MLHARVCSLILRVPFFCHPERSATKACPHQESRARSRRTPRDSPAPCDLREFLPKLVPVTAVLTTCCWLCEGMHIATRISTPLAYSGWTCGKNSLLRHGRKMLVRGSFGCHLRTGSSTARQRFGWKIDSSGRFVQDDRTW